MSDFPYGLKPALSYNLALTVTAATTPNTVTQGTRVLRLISTVSAKFVLNATPVAGGLISVYLPINVPEYIQCSGSGDEKIAAFATAGTGTLNITEMTQ
jgi:hypothetical protein